MQLDFTNLSTPSMSRKPLFAAQGVVATSQPLAAQAGLSVLKQAGNAVDAALAAAITLTVVEPVSCDVGSDLFAMVWDGATLHGLNGSGLRLKCSQRRRCANEAMMKCLSVAGYQ